MAFVLIILALFFLGLAIWAVIDDQNRKNKLRRIHEEHEQRIAEITSSTNTTPAKPVIHDYGIDMTKVNVMGAEKLMMETVSKQQRASADPAYAYQLQIEQAWKRGDYDFVRAQLQKIAYTMVGSSVSPDEKQRFTELMKAFAKEDPLYKDVMSRLSPLLNENPGMIQSQIYKDEPDHIKEQMRYVLYFAETLGHIRREKKGNSYKLYSPNIKEMYGNKFIETKRKDGVVTFESLPKYAGGTDATITATIDEETAELSREATRLKDAGDMDGAVQALKKVKDRTGTAGVRLPLFLQQAGRFDEAMVEFNILLSEVDEQYARDFSHQPEFIQKGQALHAKATIYDKMRLACKRQKLPEEAAKFESLRDNFRDEFEAYREVADRHYRKR